MQEYQAVSAGAGQGVACAVGEKRRPSNTSALAALCTLARLHQIAADPATLAHQLGLQPSQSASTQDLLRAAKHVGLQAKLSRTTLERLPLSSLPALALLRSDNGEVRSVVLAQCDGQRVLLQDPSSPGSGARPRHGSIE